MNGILSIGTALGASLYILVGEFVFINPMEMGQLLVMNFMNLKLPTIIKNILF